jgi:hypothetical protein
MHTREHPPEICVSRCAALTAMAGPSDQAVQRLSGPDGTRVACEKRQRARRELNLLKGCLMFLGEPNDPTTRCPREPGIALPGQQLAEFQRVGEGDPGELCRGRKSIIELAGIEVAAEAPICRALGSHRTYVPTGVQ